MIEAAYMLAGFIFAVVVFVRLTTRREIHEDELPHGDPGPFYGRGGEK